MTTGPGIPHPVELAAGRRCRARYAVGRHLAAIAAALVCLVATAGPAAAARVVVGDAVRVPAGTSVADDLYLAGGTARVDGDVAGDLTLGAAFANVVGDVDGSITAIAGRAEIRGRVAGSVRAVGAHVAVYGRVDGDVVAVAGSVRIVEGASIGGDVVAAGGSVTLVATSIVGGEVRGYAGGLRAEGRVRGDVRVTSPRLMLAPGARIDGSLVHRGNRPPVIDTGAAVLGATVHRPLLEGVAGGKLLGWEEGAVPRLAAMLGAGLLGILLVPRTAAAVADGARRRPLPALLVGVGVASFLPVALLLLAMTLVGLPLAAVGVSLFLGGAYVSQAVVGLALGRLVLRLSRDNGRRGANLAAMAIGVVAVSAVRLLPVPYLDPALALLVALLGLGALALNLDRGLRRRPTAVAEAGNVAMPSAVAASVPAASPGR